MVKSAAIMRTATPPTPPMTIPAMAPDEIEFDLPVEMFVELDCVDPVAVETAVLVLDMAVVVGVYKQRQSQSIYMYKISRTIVAYDFLLLLVVSPPPLLTSKAKTFGNCYIYKISDDRKQAS